MANEDGSEVTLSQLLYKPWSPLDAMRQKDMREEIELWRTLASWLPQDVKYWLSHVGDTVRLVRRDYKQLYGTLLQTQFEMISVEVGLYERIYDQNNGKYYNEQKTSVLPRGSITAHEFIIDRFEEEAINEDAAGAMTFEEAK